MYHAKIVRKRYGIYSIAIALLLPLGSMASAVLLPMGSMASADSYLEELEQEAKKSAKVSSKKTKLSKTNQDKMERFSQLLQFERPATFKFFKKLSLEKKTKVLDTYGTEKRLSAASKKIFDLYFEQK